MQRTSQFFEVVIVASCNEYLSWALATRFGPALQHVVDPTQTAFVPGRWIGDNVLCHLEEVEYLQQTGQPGCKVFFFFFFVLFFGLQGNCPPSVR